MLMIYYLSQSILFLLSSLRNVLTDEEKPGLVLALEYIICFQMEYILCIKKQKMSLLDFIAVLIPHSTSHVALHSAESSHQNFK